MIGITGDSGSGKTTYSNGIRRLLGPDIVTTIDMDGYHKENREQRKKSGKLPLDPSMNKLDLLLEHLKLLKEGKSVMVPIYDHEKGEFKPPIPFSPSPIIIIEGLHALYPEFLPYLDFSIYVDPARSVKWEWKYQRDVEKRHHIPENLIAEMLQREAAYKRFIDFQKTNASIVIKINPSKINDMARYELSCPMPTGCYKVELIIETAPILLPAIRLTFDLSAMLDPADKSPFMLAGIPSVYWGRKVIDVYIDGILSQHTINSLRNNIVAYTGIPLNEAMDLQYAPLQEHEHVTATQFAQLVIAWRFLEQIHNQISHLRIS
ncbi:phosphoribulokinase [Candidatus Gottesmanbacteria bacterium RBG_13_37_7]|uniref:phosphoribulokinase n=1 Tax=Candidatus Gottesmanbacteria bacterium RBG_13_37_7 TaxID=1798369 RepID=A0A1F5YJK7_9BACT|nr:MAG: phosphoribulokinase [Candidatus Gottesmanbacteria bacterium RBG_13_37_7]